jgi:OOP family OmpA-OmpF porin
MIKSAFLLLFAVLLGSVSLVHAAGDPPGESAEKLHLEQLQQIETLQRRADKLAFGNIGADNYHLAKARLWLDMALSEYHENEYNGLVPAAIVQAGTLLDALEKNLADISMDTPQHISGSEAVRPDLWKKIAALKKNKGFSCGQRPVAEAEIHLVWAGHEKLESSWAHAESYALRAENLIKEAQMSIDKCPPPPPVAPLPPAPVSLPPVLKKITLSGDALFDSGKSILHPSSLPQLDKLAEDLKKVSSLEDVVLTGHTDRMGIKYPQRNQILSEQRAESIKQYLVSKGIPAEKIRTAGAGASQPLVQCSTKQSKAKQIACLQPNRRVEIVVHGIKEESGNNSNSNNPDGKSKQGIEPSANRKE